MTVEWAEMVFKTVTTNIIAWDVTFILKESFFRVSILTIVILSSHLSLPPSLSLSPSPPLSFLTHTHTHTLNSHC